MIFRNTTKQAFAQALKSQLAAKDLSAIRVQDLCRLCGTERPTFYYHFRDKYDLVTWVYEQDLRQTIGMPGEPFHVDQLEQLLLLMQKEQIFYKKALADPAQNALLPYIHQRSLSLAQASLHGPQSQESLTQEEIFHIRMLAYSWCHCLLDWISGEYDFTAAQYARLMYRSIPLPESSKANP